MIKYLLVLTLALHMSKAFPVISVNNVYQPFGENELALQENYYIPSAVRIKRQFQSHFGDSFPKFPSGGASQADAQAQGFNVKSPLGSFGASSSGSQTQAIGYGPGGLSTGAGFSGSQQYYLPNGQRIDVSFGNSFSSANGNAANAGSSAVTVTNPDGSVANL